jgi:hypothetical protein
VIAEMHAVDQQRDEVEAIERHALPGRELRRRPGDEAPADHALARAAALHLRTDRLQAPRVLPRRNAHEHLLDDAPVEWISGRHRRERGQRDLAGGRAHARTLERDLPATEDDFAARGTGPARRPLGLVGIPRPADGRAIFLEHGGEDLQARSQRQFQQFGLRVDEQIDERQMTQGGFRVRNE